MQLMPGLSLDVSLWSADLANLESEIRRLEPVADSFHFDAADGHFVPSLLFFPDLIARLRRLTRVPFHLHLMATRPLDLLDAFLEAGVDRVSVPLENGKRVGPVLDRLAVRGVAAGLSVDIETPWMLLKDFLPRIDTVLVMGTVMGAKGLDLDPRALDKIRAIKGLQAKVRVFADGGIREHTVPLLRDAGADGIVPGSLICGSGDVAGTRAWLKSLQ
jgi:ribulose-phosphate 3-epimerase